MVLTADDQYGLTVEHINVGRSVPLTWKWKWGARGQLFNGGYKGSLGFDPYSEWYYPGAVGHEICRFRALDNYYYVDEFAEHLEIYE